MIALRLGFSSIQAASLGVATLAIPMFPYLAGSVNNENLCYLGVAVFFYGLVSLQLRINLAAYICALGLLMVLLTKATGAVFLLAFIGIWSSLSFSDARSLIKNRHIRIAAMLATILCAGYFFPTRLAHHSFFPAPGTIYQDRAAPVNPISLAAYLGVFSHLMLDRLPVIMAARAYFPVPGGLVPLFYLMLGAPLLAWASYRPFSPASPNRRIADAFFLALLATLCIRLWVAWQGYLRTGLYGGLQPRYYAYALPGIFLFTTVEAENFAW